MDALGRAPLGARFEPMSLLVEMACKGRRFYG
jgi:hypothetical protein